MSRALIEIIVMPKETTLLTVSIVNYRSADLLPACLASLRRYLRLPYEVIIVQHSDEEISVPENMPVRIVKQENRGFGAGHNRAARLARGKYLFFLNPDTELIMSIDPLLELMRNRNIGVCAPELLTADGRPQKYASGRDVTLFSLLREKFAPAAPPRRGGRTVVDWVSGAAMLVRRAEFLALGMFDENFFLYFEDADLCRRFRQTGQKVVFDSTVRLRHIGGRSFSDRRGQKKHYDLSQDLYLRKYSSRATALLAAALRKIYRLCPIGER